MEIERCISWAVLHGLVVSNNGQDGSMIHAPISLLPYQFPKDTFHHAQNLAPVFNSLVHRVASNSQWLLQTLENTATHDPFTGRLMNIYMKILQDGVKQPIVLGLHRSDYMLHSVENDPRTFMQVELNTIASSFGALSSKVSEMHRVLSLSGSEDLSPLNNAHTEFAKGIAQAHGLYLSQRRVTTLDRKVCVVMIVQPGERNVADQWHLKFELFEKYGITCLRYSLQEVLAHGKIDKDDDSILRIHHDEISVVYFRAGYTPDDYPTESEWLARELIEFSAAVKCPNISYHLAGTKKVQQVLANPNELEKFMNPEECAQLRQVFAGLHSLDPKDSSIEKVEEVKAMIQRDAQHYVLKPQREGGGNNIYGEDILSAFKTMSAEELSAYILMEKILPPSQRSTLIRRGVALEALSVCELGIYSVYLSSTNHHSQPEEVTHMNSYSGYLLRVKAEDVSEGGVAAGFSVLSSVHLQN